MNNPELIQTAVVLVGSVALLIYSVCANYCSNYSDESNERREQEIYKLRDLFVTCYEIEQSNPNCIPASLEYDDEYAAARDKIGRAYEKYKGYVYLQEPFAPETLPADANAILKERMLENSTVRLDPPEDPAKAMDREVLLAALRDTVRSLGYEEGTVQVHVEEPAVIKPHVPKGYWDHEGVVRQILPMQKDIDIMEYLNSLSADTFIWKAIRAAEVTAKGTDSGSANTPNKETKLVPKPEEEDAFVSCPVLEEGMRLAEEDINKEIAADIDRRFIEHADEIVAEEKVKASGIDPGAPEGDFTGKGYLAEDIAQGEKEQDEHT